MNTSTYIFLASLIILNSCTDRDPNYTVDKERTQNEVPQSNGCDGANYSNWRDSPYVLPYPVGESYLVNLSHCTSSYHAEGEPDQFAIDFSMQIGTLITAVIGGTVIYVEESGVDGNHPNNLIVIQNTNGTYAQYMHLTNEGSLVEVGETVVTGQPIGYSGATGLAGYPHLHFIITSGGWEYPYQGIPYNFRNTSANPQSLLSNEYYEALPY